MNSTGALVLGATTPVSRFPVSSLRGRSSKAGTLSETCNQGLAQN
jgi:hypothetical protein